MEIGRGHRLALTSRLVVLDEALCEFERWAQGYAATSALYEEKNDLTPAQRQAILEQVEPARRTLAEMREAFGLEKQTQPVRRSVVSQCAVLWELLTELEPKYLSHYGAVDDELATRVTEGVEELRQRIVRIGRVVAGESAGGGDPPPRGAGFQPAGGEPHPLPPLLAGEGVEKERAANRSLLRASPPRRAGSPPHAD